MAKLLKVIISQVNTVFNSMSSWTGGTDCKLA